jgi:hypothetical protein
VILEKIKKIFNKNEETAEKDTPMTLEAKTLLESMNVKIKKANSQEDYKEVYKIIEETLMKAIEEEDYFKIKPEVATKLWLISAKCALAIRLLKEEKK